MFLNIHKRLLVEVLYVVSKITRQPRKNGFNIQNNSALKEKFRKNSF